MEQLTEEQPSEILTPYTENATYFKPSESTDPEKFRRFRLYNRGTWKDRREENKSVTHRGDNLAILDTIAGELELTENQQEDARNVLDELDLQKLGRSVKKIAFAVCCIVANDYCPRGKRHWPTQGGVDENFLEFGKELGIRPKKQLSLIFVVQSHRSRRGVGEPTGDEPAESAHPQGVDWSRVGE